MMDTQSNTRPGNVDARGVQAGGTKKKKDKAPAKTPEQRKQERRDRFVRLAAKRVNRALSALENVARMGNRNGYEYTEEEAKKVVAAITEAAKKTADEFQADVKRDTSFSL